MMEGEIEHFRKKAVSDRMHGWALETLCKAITVCDLIKNFLQKIDMTYDDEEVQELLADLIREDSLIDEIVNLSRDISDNVSIWKTAINNYNEMYEEMAKK